MDAPDIAPLVPAPRRDFNPLEAAVGVVTRPAMAMREIALARPWLIALALYIVIGAISSLANLTTVQTSPDQVPPEMRETFGQLLEATRSPAALIGSAVILGPLGLLIASGIFYLIGRLFSGHGPFSALFSTLAYSLVPSLLVAPVTALLNLAGTAFSALAGLLGLASGIWVLALQVIGIRESMGLTTGKAIATLLIPLAVLVLLICAVVAVIVFAVVGAISGASS